MPHHHDDVAALRPRRARPAARARAPSARLVEHERCRPGRGARGLRTARARDRDDDRRQGEQPGERNLLGGRCPCRRDLHERRVAGEACGAPHAAERRVRDERDPPLLAALEHAASSRAVVEQAQRHLHRGDGSQLERLVELRPVDVRHADAAHEAVTHEPRKRAHRRPPGRARVGRVDEEEVDRKPVERLEARLAVGADRLRTAIRDPAAAGPRHAALRDDAGIRAAEQPRPGAPRCARTRGRCRRS